MELIFSFSQSNTPKLIAGAYILISLLLVLILFIFLQIRRINKKNEVFFSGKKISSLESMIIESSKSLKEIDQEIQDLYDISNKLNIKSSQALSKVGIVRYNPFRDIGGNQSFSIALLDEDDSGMVITSLHTREGNRVYAKPISRGNCKNYPLTNEERKAIKMSSAMKKNNI